MIDLTNLTSEQNKAVTSLNKRLLVIAGPGTGKTHTLITKVEYLIKHQKTPSQKICIFTFSRKAANELNSRVSDLTTPAGFCGTIHSFFLNLLKLFKPDFKNFTVISEDAQKNIINNLIKENNLEYSIKEAITIVKQYKLENNSYTENNPLIEAYQTYLKLNKLIDFDDIIISGKKLIETKEFITNHLSKYEYLLIDEFQDLNNFELECILPLLKNLNSFFIIGDPFQSIYGFKFSRTSNFTFLKENFPDLQVINLTQNFRSSNEIIITATEFINNFLKTKVNLKSQFNHTKPRLLKFKNKNFECSFIIDEIQKLTGGTSMLEHDSMKVSSYIHNVIDFKDIAIIYRTHILKAPVELALKNSGIPFHEINPIPLINRKAVKEIFSYLSLINNFNDDEALLKIINFPPRGIGKKTKDELKAMAKTLKSPIFPLLPCIASGVKTHSSASALNNFFNLITNLKNISYQMKCSEFINHIIEITKISSNIDKQYLDDINEFINFAKAYDKISPPYGLSKFLHELVTSPEPEIKIEINAVHLASIHSVKGLEFDTVFLIDIVDGILPFNVNKYTSDEAEEARLFYVALTRAKTRLYLLYPETITLFGKNLKKPSRFLKFIPQEFIDTNLPEDFSIKMKKQIQRKKIKALKKKQEGEQISLF